MFVYMAKEFKGLAQFFIELVSVPQKVVTGLEITAGQRTMSGLIGELTSQLFVLPVMLTGHNRSY